MATSLHCDREGEMQKSAMEYIINHVVSPPKLPQKDDYSSRNERWLIHHALEALKLFGAILQKDQADAAELMATQRALAMLNNLASVHSDDGTSTYIDGKALQESFSQLHHDAAPVPLYVRAQNAAILVSSAKGGTNFEVFELSPLNKDVMGTAGRLQRTFPGCAVMVPREVAEEPLFLEAITATLAKMSQQPAYGTKPMVKKARQKHQEGRDTTNPKMVTELFVAYLRSVGKMVEVSSILKSTRQNVLWKDAKSPWHRSALWLLVRVILQLFLSRQGSELVRANTYKNYMLFFMAYILQKASDYEIPADLMWSIKAKVTRRRLKLSAYSHPDVLQFVDNILSEAAASLEARWSKIQKHYSVRHDFSDLKELPTTQDVIMHLEGLDRYIEAITKREYCTQSAKLHQTCPLPECASPLDNFYLPLSAPIIFRLLRFESWVEFNLDSWLKTAPGNEETCRELRSVIESYHTFASDQYWSNPEAMSTMFLTIMQLWVALDESAIKSCDLLADYAPYFTAELLRSLILPERRQMERLKSIEEYLSLRFSEAQFSASYIFQLFGHEDCFAVRYFNQSEKQQDMLSNIVKRAETAREEKRIELEEKRNEYLQHKREYEKLECQYVEVFNRRIDDYEERHSEHCERCRHRRAMDSLEIEVHEWPLPENDNEAKTVVFELCVPPSLSYWRDSTVFMSTNVLGFEYEPQSVPQKLYTTEHIEGLHHFIEYDAERRISLRSETKPHSRTHRNIKSVIATSIGEVCVRNGATFMYFDSRKECFINTRKPIANPTTEYTYSLSTASSSLQQFLGDAIHPTKFSNTVIATQSECPQDLSLEERKGMASLRAGSKIKWHNILKELALPSVDFRKDDTTLIILQCIHQAGQPDIRRDVLRETHSILGDERFSTTLLERLSNACERVSGNWQSAPALSAFISIAARVLSLSSAAAVQQSSLKILSRARAISLNWVQILKQKAQTATEDRVREDFMSKTAFVALICADSFNIDSQYMREVLSVAEEASILIQMAIVIQECRHKKSKFESLAILLYRRWHQLCLHSFPVLAEEVTAKRSPALDEAIRSSWVAYRPAGEWRALKAPYHHWVTSKSAVDRQENALVVQYSMLTGELLVNGLPLNRLPKEYEKADEYRTLFGNATIEVMPSSVKGMLFSGKQMFADHQLHFNFGTQQNTLPEGTLIVRASNQDSTLEFISPKLLYDKFPRAFVDDFVHWYDVEKGYIEFRPRDLAWSHSNANWKLHRVNNGGAWQLTKAEKSLIDIRSRTAARFSEIFQTLEDALYIHVTLDPTANLLEIELPRIQLGFSATLYGTSIKSHQHRGMSIHEDQTIGALIGFQSKLVLKNDKANARDRVIIPNGKISYDGATGGRVRVMTDKNSSTKTYVYEIDRQLGRIIDNGTLTSKLVLAYIHGLTSFCLADPLTKSTGTNAALTILRSAAVRSFPSVDQEDIGLLEKISKLTPMRKYYPEHLQEMETVNWSTELSFLAQHSEYYERIESLIEHFQKAQLFHPEIQVGIKAPHTIHRVLLQREKIQSAFVRLWDFGAQHYTQDHDKVYSPRDRSQDSEEAIRALSLSTMVLRGKPNPQVPMEHDIGHHLWKFLRDNWDFLDSSPPSLSSYEYDAVHLVESAKIISEGLLARFRAFDTGGKINGYVLMVWLASLSFAKDVDMTILQVIASFFFCTAMNRIEIPDIRFFDLHVGYDAKKEEVKKLLEPGRKKISDTPIAKLAQYRNESNSAYRSRKSRELGKSTGRTVEGFIKELMEQWPCEKPQAVSRAEWEEYIDVDKVMPSVVKLFRQWHSNRRLRQYLRDLGNSTPRASVTLDAPVRMPAAPRKPAHSEIADRNARGFVTTDDVFSGPAPLHVTGIRLDTLDVKVTAERERGISLLPNLLTRLDGIADSPFEATYMANLRDSLSALSGLAYRQDTLPDASGLCKVLLQRRDELKKTVNEVYSAIIDAATTPIYDKLYAHSGKNQSGSFLAQQMSQLSIYGRKAISNLPLLQHFQQLCHVFFLQHLSRKRWSHISDDWKKCLIHYGVALTQLQRANRLLEASGNPASLMKELQDRGHENWDPYEHPESLLLEIENGIMIRNVQEQIAAQMRNPNSGNNAVMQLNMGEGKSSVIVPIVATSLADTTRLVRVIVAKPQSKQMLQMLISKLGGLLDRQIYHLPFSRAIKVESYDLMVIVDLLNECMKSGGILLTQPENILSFMLMGIESRISGGSSTNKTLVKTLGFLDANSRDIVDESDENFSVKFELLYTMGLQRPIQYSPERWICVQDVLEIIRKMAPKVQREFPTSIEIYQQPIGGFPRIRILREDAQNCILVRIAEEICDKGLKGFPIVRQKREFRQAVFRYITRVQPSSTDIRTVEDDSATGFWANSHDALLLLRGLLAGGILSFCFGQKRWRVDYGLDSSRKPATGLALPFRAKDSPTPRSEFSHPEVVIVLTQLCYYYGGLSNKELEVAFRHLLISDQPDVEFQLWVRETTELSNEFKQISGINLTDQSTCEERIFPHLRFSKGVIDYYLSNCVFPKEMKEFPHKLSASGWDIGKIKQHPTTGFSGTNDSRAVLPLSVDQLDLYEQKHTNALVLEYLLQPENSVALMPSRVGQEKSDAEMLLDMVIGMDPPVRVILDVGAQILELDNLELAKKWLSSVRDSRDIEAVVFFSINDELSVLDRKGLVEPLQVSPYINQLDHCLVFLDESHTRGTDLKLPRHYRAAVTLGAHLTKDRLVQACMRMRLLGKGQSVIFCVPEEISSQIQRRLPKVQSVGEPAISVSDILAWAITETWNDAKRNILLWAAQGRRHEKHKGLWAQCHTAGDALTEELAEQFLEDEAQSLEDRYRPIQDRDEALLPDDDITRRCRQFNNIKLGAAVLQEEQERELAPEIEQERQDERPASATARTHSLHPHALAFVKTGSTAEKSSGYMGAFMSLRETSAASLFDVSKFDSSLLVSVDFARTVNFNGFVDKSDGYQRPVQWILTASRTPHGAVDRMMIISPYEADNLLSDIQESKHVALHLYAPCCNSGYPSLDKLDLYTVPEALKDREIPRRLITALNLFSGQLYIDSFENYVDICKFLGLSREPTKDGEIIGADGFIYRDSAGRVGGESGLSASPVEFFKVFLAKIRRNCETIDKTHMGQVLNNQLLSPEDFE